MATPKPGEIRCPTCHRSTPPAAFCTQCGSAIPPDARIRPRGMDRDELQDRIRARRSGGDPYRRGTPTDEPASPYRRFEPEPEDGQARRARGTADARREDYLREPSPGTSGPADRQAPPPAAIPAEPPSLTRDRDEWDDRPITTSGPTIPPTVVPPTSVPPPATPLPSRSDEPEYVDNFDDARYEDEAYTYEYDEWDDDRGKRGGAGAFAILGFLALGVLALLGGALLAGLFGGDGGTGQVDTSPSPSISASAEASSSAAATPAPSGDVSAAPSGSAAASGEPVLFPDGFTAEAEPCLPGSATASGCNSNGVDNSGSVDIWVGFKNGNVSDVVGASVIGPDGNSLGTGSMDLARIGCGQSCNGWTWFPFGNLEPGTYQVEITRNGEYASATSFEVS